MRPGTARNRRSLLAVLSLLLVTRTALAATSLAEWAGHYEDQRFNQSVEIDRQGRVEVAGSAFRGGDAGFPFRAEGTLRPDGDAVAMALHPERGADDMLQPPSQLLAPRRLLPFLWAQHHVLLEDRDLALIVNEVNLYGQHRVSVTDGLLEVRAEERGRAIAIMVDADTMLPPAWRARLLATPLVGHLVRVVSSTPAGAQSGPSSFAVGPPPRDTEVAAAAPEPQRITVEVDLGAADGVFPGMILNDLARGSTYFWVDAVEAHRCTMSTTTTVPIAAGDLVASTFSQPGKR
jgi:hypothetical protein